MHLDKVTASYMAQLSAQASLKITGEKSPLYESTSLSLLWAMRTTAIFCFLEVDICQLQGDKQMP